MKAHLQFTFSSSSLSVQKPTQEVITEYQAHKHKCAWAGLGSEPSRATENKQPTRMTGTALVQGICVLLGLCFYTSKKLPTSNPVSDGPEEKQVDASVQDLSIC